MKVPLVLAAMGEPGSYTRERTRELATAAITRSDNAAAEALWAGLGPAPVAAAKTQGILRRAGDSTTVVNAERARSGFSAYGQSSWTLANQAAFAAGLACMKGSATVLSLMRQIAPAQRWGLGVLKSKPAFKGGWGPDPSGAYLVRQMGVVTLGDGSQVGVALAAAPSDGSFATGQQMATEIARWIEAHLRVGGDAATGC